MNAFNFRHGLRHLTSLLTRNMGRPREENVSNEKATVFYVQPLITRYRMEVIDALGQRFNVKLFASSDHVESHGFSREQPECDEFIDTGIRSVLFNRVKVQAKVLRRIVRDRPAAVLIFADINYLSLWFVLLVGKVLGIPIVVHGQGMFRHKHASWLRIFCHRAVVMLAARYICYSDLSKRSLERIGCKKAQLVVADNSLKVSGTVSPTEKTGDELGVLFLGRLRNGSNVEHLIQAVEKMRQQGFSMILHLIGDGEHRRKLEQVYSDRTYVIWYGAIFDEREIAKISRACRIGCYPGAAGLSVVHLFGLSLPPLVHDQLHEHMGPEPEYVADGVTGFLYEKEGGEDALLTSLKRVWELPAESIRGIGFRSFAKYVQLNSPTLGHRLAEIVDGEIYR